MINTTLNRQAYKFVLSKQKGTYKMTVQEICALSRKLTGYSKEKFPLYNVIKTDNEYIVAYQHADGIMHLGGAELIFAYTKDGKKIEAKRPFYEEIDYIFETGKKVAPKEFKDL